MKRKSATPLPVKNVRIPTRYREAIAAAAFKENRSSSNFVLTAALERIAIAEAHRPAA